MKKKKKKKSRHASKHHIIPVSRGGDSSLENIAKVDGRNHQFYHSLFSNRRPEEIVEYLVNDYWNGQWKYVERAYKRNNEIYKD